MLRRNNFVAAQLNDSKIVSQDGFLQLQGSMRAND
jgi:hypothetical protein